MFFKKYSKKEKIGHGMVWCCILLFLVFLFFFQQNVTKKALLPDDGSSFEQAEVMSITKDNLQSDGTRVGTQYLSIRISSGKYKGKTMEATNINGYLHGASEVASGTKIIIQLSDNNGSLVASVYNYDRGNTIYMFIILFLLVIIAIGGRKGLSAVISLVFTFICIFFLYLPLIYLGYSPFLSACIVATAITMVTMYLIGGFSHKTLCSIVGTILGVIVSGAFASLFGSIGHITGFNVEEIETLVYIGQNTPIQIGGLLFSGVLISALGAVMDVAMSVATTIEEIVHHNPAISKKSLFKSGMKIGSDMMGTMSNTLILAFTGTSLYLLIINYSYNFSFLQMINSYTIGIEIMQGIAGTLGVVLTVPFVSVICCIFMVKKKSDLPSKIHIHEHPSS